MFIYLYRKLYSLSFFLIKDLSILWFSQLVVSVRPCPPPLVTREWGGDTGGLWDSKTEQIVKVGSHDGRKLMITTKMIITFSQMVNSLMSAFQ